MAGNVAQVEDAVGGDRVAFEERLADDAPVEGIVRVYLLDLFDAPLERPGEEGRPSNTVVIVWLCTRVA